MQYILSDENVIFMDFFAVKVDGSDVIAGIYKEVFIQRDSRYDITSVNFSSEKVHEDDIFSSDKIYYNFSQENPKITNI